MAITIQDTGVSLLITDGIKKKYITKIAIKEITNDPKTILIDYGNDSTDKYYANYADITVPTSIDIDDLVEQLNDLANIAGMTDEVQSSGQIEGGVVTDNGGLTINLSLGRGYARKTDDPTAAIIAVPWTVFTNQALVDDADNQIYIKYDGTFASSVTALNHNQYIHLAEVHTQDGDIIFIHNTPHYIGDFPTRVFGYHDSVHGNMISTGMSLTDEGLRKVRADAGLFYTEHFTPSIVTAKDTSGAGTFILMYKNGTGGFTQVPGQTQINNSQYDDGDGTLGTLGSNKWRVDIAIRNTSDSFVVVLGQAEYTNQAAAEIAPLPDLPPGLAKHGVLIAKVVIQEGAAEITNILDTRPIHGVAEGASNHGALGGLQGGNAAERFHLLERNYNRISAATATLADGATITFNASLYASATVTLGGNRALAFSNLVSGDSGNLIVIQDVTGTRTLALPGNAIVIDAGGGAIALSSAGDSVDVISWVYDGTDIYITLGKNFT